MKSSPVKALSPRLTLVPLEDRCTPAAAFALAGNSLLSFDTATPTVSQTTAITGIAAGETLAGIDFRPQNGYLYGLGVNASTDTASLYNISTRTGVATLVGAAPGSIRYVQADGTTPVDLPDPATVGYGFDFNPVVDRIRIVAGSLNARANPNTGGPVDGDPVGTGINPDGAVSGGTTTVDAAGYTNSQPNTAVTTLYTLDAASNSLFIQNPANAGPQTLGQVVTLNGSPLDFSNVSGFDIPAGVNAPSSNAAVTSGSAFAVLTVGGTPGLYRIDLATAQATFVGAVGTAPVSGLAVQSSLGGFPAIGLTGNGTQLVRSNTATPNTGPTVTITGVSAGDTLVGIDFRPQTGQLYGLGVNAGADTATLYLIDPQTGAATVVGAVGSIAYVQADGTTPVDLPDPATAGYGFDFNPTVDRIRITTSTGLNARANPNNGAAADGSAAGTGTNPDGPVSGLPVGGTGVSSAAYTNSFGQTLPGPATTLYTLDAASNSLFIQNPANGGGQTAQLKLTLGGTPLDFTDVTGFDIPPGVAVSASNAPATGAFGYATLTVGGVSSLYRINLTTGVVNKLGATAATGGLALGDAPAGTGAAVTSGVVSATANGLTVLNADGSTRFTLNPYPGFAGGFSVARGDLNGDGVADIVTGAGAGGGPHVKVFDGVTGAELRSFFAYSSAFTGGVFVALGDLNGDGLADIITGTGAGGGSHVRAFDSATGAELRSFFAYTPAFTGGVRVASADVNGDGIADIVTVAGPGGNSHVEAFSGTDNSLLRSFFAYPGFAGEVFVAAGDLDGDGNAEIVTGSGRGTPGHVKTFSGADNSLQASFFAYNTNFTGGARVAVADADGDGVNDLVTGAGPGGGPNVKVFGANGLLKRSYFGGAATDSTGVFVG